MKNVQNVGKISLMSQVIHNSIVFLKLPTANANKIACTHTHTQICEARATLTPLLDAAVTNSNRASVKVVFVKYKITMQSCKNSLSLLVCDSNIPFKLGT
jgi:hypothetical protein